MVLSIALIQIFEDRSLEVAQLENSTQQFKAESVARSVFRVLLGTIHEMGLYQVVSTNRPYQKLGFSTDVIDLAVLTDLSIEPIDYRFDLNQKFKGDDSERELVFKNILIQCQLENKDQETESYFDLMDQDVFRIISAINDWMDYDSEAYDIYGEGIELYGETEYPFEIKNRRFDFLSEIKMIPSVNQLKLSDYIVKKHFRVSDNSSPKEFININLAEKDTIIAFFKRFEDVSDYETIVANAEQIADSIIQDRTDPPKPPKYSTDKDIYSTKSTFREEMEEDTLYALFTEQEKKVFNTKSTFVEIKYTIMVDHYQLSVNSLIKLGTNDGKDRIIIHTFSMN